MKRCFLLGCTFLFSCLTFSQTNLINKNRVESTIDSTHTGNIVLIQKFYIKAPLEDVWNVFTTKKGWESVFVPLAEVDFKIGGSIRSSYDKNATIGDSSTIVNNIINFVPKKVITLQAELSPHFPEFMKKDAQDFYNIIYFDEINASNTEVTSYGIGYKNTRKYKELLHFFIKGNEAGYLNLIKYLETGEKVKF
ncbi:SRPBCC domain-containing protein [Spongiivirga sp. MCCC 1A20706]|uniref:SRPBCC domain-containing protein n=1 Tax=Spongiivirga sp. MCCC 1A20706 TaxID=3160963 RepID=UPI0039775DA7